MLTVALGKSFYTSGSFIGYSDVNVITMSNIYYFTEWAEKQLLCSQGEKKQK